MLSSTSFADNQVINLSLKEAVRLAVENNLSLKAELYNPAQAEADIRKNRAIYETRLLLNSSYQDTTTFLPNTLEEYNAQQLIITPGLSKLFPTGGTAEVHFDNQYNRQPTSGIGYINGYPSYWQSDISLKLNQPLLKNFGRDATELNIKVAEMTKKGSLKHLKTAILSMVAQVRTEYFKLRSYQDDLQSKKKSLELAKQILFETEARVKAGVLPAMEILNARYGVALREGELIDAEKTAHDQRDVLALLLQLDSSADIIPIDSLDKEAHKFDQEEALKLALANRPDLDEIKTSFDTAALQTKVLRSQTLPTLNLVSSVAFTGAATKYNRNIEHVGSTDYPIWSVGIQFEYPLGNQEAENDYIKSRLKTEQIETQIEGLKASIANEVRTAIRGVDSAYKQLDISDKAAAYADERFRAYLKKSEVGLATNKDVLDVENDLSTARSNQIKAQTTYETALTQYWKATGELLEREGINVEVKKSDALYNKIR